MQQIRFGLMLDGQRGWQVHDALGVSTVGPLGMLNLLEIQLGLVQPATSFAERAVQMRACLAEVVGDDHFFTRSFASDELGIAAALLAWRDHWYEHGWNGRFPDDATPRLRDMAAVERLACHRVAPGVGQRLAAVETALAARRPQIDRVDLVEPIGELPLQWQRVLARLPTAEMPAPSVSAEAGTVLASLQAALLATKCGGAIAPVPWQDDGSLTVIRAETPLSGAEWLARRIATAAGTQVIVAPAQAGILDAAFEAAGLPRAGLSGTSPYRPPLQLLPLALRLVWAPVDFTAMLQFLSLPDHPVFPYARARIGRKFAEAPGFGGVQWDAAMTDIAAHYGEASAGAVLAEIGFWVDHPRFPRDGTAPLAAIEERVLRLEAFFRSRLTDEGETRRAGWLAGHDQAKAMLQAVRALLAQGVMQIRREALERLTAQVTARGVFNPLLRAQAGTTACVTDPAALIEPFDNVSWWHLAAVPQAARHPWSGRELTQLREAGVALPDAEGALATQAASWTRPIFMARRHLTLVLPGAGEEVHPIWQLLSTLLENVPIPAVEDLLSQPPQAGTVTVPHRPLPARRRWWQLPAHTPIVWPSSQSFTSLDQLIFNPYEWVLRYPARLQSSSLLCLPDDFRLLGNLAHRLVERLYRQDGSLQWDRARVQHWFDHNLGDVVAEEGAVLLMPGRRAELEVFRLRFRNALAQLHDMLQLAGATIVEPEVRLEAMTSAGLLSGAADLRLTNPSLHRTIVDMKWAGDTKYREKLQQRKHVQLALYARLDAEERGRWPEVGYFILRSGVWLNKGAETTEALWHDIDAAWRWRRVQVDSGLIELVFEDLPETDASIPPGELPIDPRNPRYNPYLFLAGWERDV